MSLGHGLSEYSFANFYLFRKVHDYAVVSDDRGVMGVSGKTYDNAACFTPLFDVTRADPAELVRLIETFGCLYPIDRTEVERLDPGRFMAGQNPDDADYVYGAEKLRGYPGRKLAAKRNLVKQFLSAYRVFVRPYHPKRRADAQTVLDLWQAENGHDPETTDYYPAAEALALARELDLFGCVFYVDDAPAGFLLAAANTPEMCTVHFAKGGRKFQGIFPYMFSRFAAANGDRFRFYNFEQDLGKPNFKKNKQSYAPDRLLAKYRVGLKN